MLNKLDRDFGFWGLLRFALPSIVMMVFMSLYTVVDGFFIARFVGPDALSATNIIYPVINVVLAAGIMLATGGSALVARRMGEGDERGARESFTFLMLCGAGIGVAFALAGLFLPEPLSRLLGASDRLIVYSVDYLRILLLFAPAYMLQLMFQSFFVAAGKPGLGLVLTVGAGVANGVLDYVFIVPLGMGIQGAALATVTGYLVPAVYGVFFFLLRRKGLRFIRPRVDWRMLGKSCFNGSSEMVTNLANGVITFLFNALMLRMLGEDGVAAITIVLYAQFLLTALYMGFSMGVAPVISFNHGAERFDRLRRTFKHCMVVVAASSAAVFAFALAASGAIVSIFSPEGTTVYALARHGFLRFSPAFLFAGFNMFASALFTAFSDGKTSAIISFARTFAFILLGLLFLPRLMGVDGVWSAVPFAEICAAALSALFLWGKRQAYHYA